MPCLAPRGSARLWRVRVQGEEFPCKCTQPLSPPALTSPTTARQGPGWRCQAVSSCPSQPCTAYPSGPATCLAARAHGRPCQRSPAPRAPPVYPAALGRRPHPARVPMGRWFLSKHDADLRPRSLVSTEAAGKSISVTGVGMEHFSPQELPRAWLPVAKPGEGNPPSWLMLPPRRGWQLLPTSDAGEGTSTEEPCIGGGGGLLSE